MSGASGTFCLWLDYALSVIQPMDHLTACRLATGGAPTPGLEADIRWPGYVGPAYESAPFRLLFVGQVHYPEELERTLGHFQNNMHTWANNPRTPRGDDRFLQLLQAEYRKAIPQWGPWKRPFSKLSNRQGLSLVRSRMPTSRNAG